MKFPGILYLFGTAVFFYIAFESIASPAVPLFVLVPLLYFLYTRETTRKAVVGSYLGGILIYLVTLRFFLSTHPLDWAGITSEGLSLFLVLFAWIVSSAVFALPFLLFGLLVYRVKTRTWLDLLTVPPAWALTQYASAFIASIVFYGPQGAIGSHFNVGNVGFLLGDTPLLLWYRVLGLHGANFLLAFLNVAVLLFVFEVISRRNKGWGVRPLATLVVTVFVFGYSFSSPTFISKQSQTDSVKRVAVVQTNRTENIFYYDTLVNLLGVKEDDYVQPDILLFPEDARLFALEGARESETLKTIFPNLRKQGLVVTSSTLTDSAGNRTQNILYRDQQGVLLSKQEKTLLVPGGEVLPYLLEIPSILWGAKDSFASFSNTRILSQGTMPEHPVTVGGISAGGLLCSSVFSPEKYRVMALDGAGVLFNSAGQAIFHADSLFLTHMKKTARFHAVAHNRPYLQASDGGQSFIVDANGTFTGETTPWNSRVLWGFVRSQTAPTPYTRFGDAPVLTLLTLLLVVDIIRNRKSQLPDPKWRLANTDTRNLNTQ